MSIFKKLLSYVLGLSVGLLAVAPPIGYSIPVVVNSYLWLYGFIVAALLGLYLLFTKLPTALKILNVYLFIGCFLSQAPYASFNAYILCVCALYVFLWLMEADYKPIIDMICAAFFLQCIMIVMQQFGVDKLMNFDRPEPVFVGTVMQYMRFSSLLAIMTPFLVIKNKKFIFLILLLAIISHSSSFSLSVIVGLTTYAFLVLKKWRVWMLATGGIALGFFCWWDWTSIMVAFTCGRIPVWGDIIKTVCFDTLPCVVPVSKNFIHCAVDWKAIFLGRGLDTFLPLFPIYKHDFNPFPQAHNDFLQIWWEIGLVGTITMGVYFINLARRLKRPLLLAGLACMSVNMFFAFPTRMTQTMLMMICYIALCERIARADEDLNV